MTDDDELRAVSDQPTPAPEAAMPHSWALRKAIQNLANAIEAIDGDLQGVGGMQDVYSRLEELETVEIQGWKNEAYGTQHEGSE